MLTYCSFMWVTHISIVGSGNGNACGSGRRYRKKTRFYAGVGIFMQRMTARISPGSAWSGTSEPC